MLTCEECQMIKAKLKSTKTTLTPIISNRPLQILTADITGPLPRSSLQHKYALVVCDHFSKWIEVFPLRTQDAQEVAKKLLKVILKFGIPDQILTDQGTNFQSELVEQIWNLLDVHKTRTTPYHPQCDGQSERFMRTLKEMISAYVSENQRDWDQKLDQLTFAYNTATHEGTKHSPFYLMFGRKPKVPLDLMRPEITINEIQNYEEYVRQLETNFKKAYASVNKLQAHKMNLAKIRHDRTVFAAKFEPGDHVWHAVKDNKQGKTKKLRQKWKGPYIVMNESEEGPYRIRLMGSKNGLTRTVNRDLLKRCYLRDPKMFFVPQLKPIQEENEVNIQWNEETIARMLDIDLFAPEIINVNSPEGQENPSEANIQAAEERDRYVDTAVMPIQSDLIPNENAPRKRGRPTKASKVADRFNKAEKNEVESQEEHEKLKRIRKPPVKYDASNFKKEKKKMTLKHNPPKNTQLFANDSIVKMPIILKFNITKINYSNFHLQVNYLSLPGNSIIRVKFSLH